MAAKDELGRAGEALAAQRLQDMGLVVLDRNWRCREGELDIVATDGRGTAVFCEVKTRSGTGYGDPLDAITLSKRRKLRRLAHLWLADHGRGWVRLRFDVVGVMWERDRAPQVTHLVEAF
jgi:putative endonuclease